jgi:hypothetical protein
MFNPAGLTRSLRQPTSRTIPSYNLRYGQALAQPLIDAQPDRTGIRDRDWDLKHGVLVTPD